MNFLQKVMHRNFIFLIVGIASITIVISTLYIQNQTQDQIQKQALIDNITVNPGESISKEKNRIRTKNAACNTLSRIWSSSQRKDN